MTYNVFSGTLNPTQSICLSVCLWGLSVCRLCLSVTLGSLGQAADQIGDRRLAGAEAYV